MCRAARAAGPPAGDVQPRPEVAVGSGPCAASLLAGPGNGAVLPGGRARPGVLLLELCSDLVPSGLPAR